MRVALGGCCWYCVLSGVGEDVGGAVEGTVDLAFDFDLVMVLYLEGEGSGLGRVYLVDIRV